MRQLSVLFACGVMMTFTNCKKDDEATTSGRVTPVCDGSTPTYDSYVGTIMAAQCTSCHGPGSSDGDYSTYAKMSSTLSNGKFLKEVLTDQTMPTASPLSEADLHKLQCWVENGYPEN